MTVHASLAWGRDRPYWWLKWRIFRRQDGDMPPEADVAIQNIVARVTGNDRKNCLRPLMQERRLIGEHDGPTDVKLHYR